MKKRHIDLETAMQNPFLDLITDYLAKELDPVKATEVERQLETDPAFRDFAEPIVAFGMRVDVDVGLDRSRPCRRPRLCSAGRAVTTTAAKPHPTIA